MVEALTHHFWERRRVLVTGHTGFKGAWLSLWLQKMGALVTGISLPPEDEKSTYCALAPWTGLDSRIADLRDASAVREVVMSAQPQVIFHLAAQALVRRGYREPFETYDTNVVGTANLLHQLLRPTPAQAAVIVTSDKVYANQGNATAFSESDRLGGSDPYSASKALAERLVQGWRESVPESRRVPVVTARAGNVVGGGDRGPERLLADAWRALEAGVPLELRYPDAIRPWQFVLEPLYGYLLLAERLVTEPATVPPAVNFGPEEESSRPVKEVVDRVFGRWGGGRWVMRPEPVAPEAATLRLDASLAERALGWRPQLSLDESLDWTVQWWEADARGDDLRALATQQIAAYEDLVQR